MLIAIKEQDNFYCSKFYLIYIIYRYFQTNSRKINDSLWFLVGAEEILQKAMAYDFENNEYKQLMACIFIRRQRYK